MPPNLGDAHLVGRRAIVPLKSMGYPRRNYDSESRKIDLKKVAGSIIPPVFWESAVFCDRAVIFSTASVAFPLSIRDQLATPVKIEQRSSGFASVLAVVLELENAVCLSAIGRCAIDSDVRLRALARSCYRVDFGALARLSSDVSRVERKMELTGRRGRDAVVQDSPGKFSVLDNGRQSLKGIFRSQKAVPAHVALDDRQEIQAIDGWCAFSSLVTPAPLGAMGAVNIAGFRIDAGGQEFDLALPELLISSCAKLVFECAGINLTQVERIEFICPFISVVARLADALYEAVGSDAIRRRLTFDNLTLGWAPSETILTSLVNPAASALLVDLSDFPEISVAIIWQ